MEIDPIAAYGEPFPEGFDTWHPSDQTQWKQTKARQVLLGAQSNAFANLAQQVGSSISVPRATPTAPQLRAMGSPVPDPTSSDSPLLPHVAQSLAEFGITGFNTVGQALSHVRNTARYLGIQQGRSKRVTSEGTTTNEASRILAGLADESAGNRRIFTGEEARLIDEAMTVHNAMQILMQKPGNVSTVLETPIDVRAKRDPRTRPTIENEAFGVTRSMATERQTQEAGMPVEDPKKVKKQDDFLSGKTSTPTPTPRTPASITIKHIPAVPLAVTKPSVTHTSSGKPTAAYKRYLDAVSAQQIAIKNQLAEHAPSMTTADTAPQSPPAPTSFEITPKPIDNSASIRKMTNEELEKAEISRSNVIKRAQEEKDMETKPINQRPDTGRPLGVQLPSGHVAPIPSHQRQQALIGDRIMDRTPWSGHPIIEL